MTRETVIADTPAARATSSIVIASPASPARLGHALPFHAALSASGNGLQPTVDRAARGYR